MGETEGATVPRTGFPYLDEPRERGEVIAMAHRGGARHPELRGWENTLRAFRHATALGYRYLETDVQVTRDGTLLAFHDDRLDRVTDREGVVAQLSAREVARARVGGSEPVPTIEDVLDALPDARLNVDLKTAGTVEPMIDLIEARGLHDRVCIGSFDERTIRRFRRGCSRPVATSCGVLAVGLVRFVPGGRHLPAMLRGAGSAFQVPLGRAGVRIVDAAFVRRAHAMSCQVHVWTVDDPDVMRELLDLGVDGLITDRTDVLRDVLTERGVWGGTR